ncbi:hypothetical protein SAMN05446589_0208 [Streptomyces sp. OV198]|jgi:hypothetical protein|nr:hypothetical protein SAMN05446589_0208 [Streptomyces sp. OV198]
MAGAFLVDVHIRGNRPVGAVCLPGYNLALWLVEAGAGRSGASYAYSVVTCAWADAITG